MKIQCTIYKSFIVFIPSTPRGLFTCVIFVTPDVDIVLTTVETYLGCELSGIFFIFTNIFLILTWGAFLAEKNKNTIKNINMK